MSGDGRIYKRAGLHWVDCHFRGRRFREPAGETDKNAKAKRKKKKQFH